MQGPELVIDNPDVNFGLVRLGDTVESSVVLRNTSQVSAQWSIRETNAESSSEVIVKHKRKKLLKTS